MLLDSGDDTFAVPGNVKPFPLAHPEVRVEGTRAEEIAEKDGEAGPKRCKGHGRLQLLLGVLK